MAYLVTGRIADLAKSLYTNTGNISVRERIMSDRSCDRIAEWAALVGAHVPDCTDGRDRPFSVDSRPNH